MKLASLTKAALIERLIAQDAQLLTQGHQLAQLREQLSIARVSAPLRQLPLHFAAAREMAMRSGKSVRVGGAA